MSSAGYASDLAAARAVWAPGRVLGGAGMFVFTTYATLPPLTGVGSTAGRGEALMLRKAVGERREKEVLLRLFDVGGHGGPAGGIADPGVRRMLAGIGDRHRRLPGMTSEYLDLFAGMIAIAPLRLRSALGLVLADGCYQRYWRYTRHAMALVGAELGDHDVVARSCARFVARHTGTGPRIAGYLDHLFAAHPDHAATARACLFPATRRVAGGVRHPSAVSRSKSASESTTSAAAQFSSRCASDDVPGIGITTGERRSSQARDT